MSDVKLGTVCIILCTFNGEKYLSEQLESIRQQNYSKWRLICRDDGSTDKSVEILENFQNSLAPGQFLFAANSGEKLGVFHGFMSLLDEANSDEIVAFCDQDDIWLPNKLERGVEFLATCHPKTPTLYCTRQILVDQFGKQLRMSPKFKKTPHQFPSSLLENIAVGCTYLLNPAAVEILKKANRPLKSIHDWWAYIVIQAAAGNILCDDAATILYRQHQHNAIGAAPSALTRLRRASTQGPRALGQQLIGHLDAILANQPLVTANNTRIAEKLLDAYQAPWPRRLKLLMIPNLKRNSWAISGINLAWMLLGNHKR
jgi:glycosyltransferase involved in cell wall biosynthesis